MVKIDNGRGGVQSNTRDEKPMKCITASERVQNFLNDTTLHGLQKLHKSQSTGRRRAWSVVVFLVWAFICLHFRMLISNFLSNESNVDFKIVDARLLQFPAVTICNANAIKKSALKALAANNAQLQQLLTLDEPIDAKKKRRRKRSIALNTWYPYPGIAKSYFLATAKKTFSEARTICKKKGGVLAQLVNREMAEEFRAAYGGKRYTIDLNDRIEEGVFRNSDGSLPIWAEWMTGEPDGEQGGNPADCTVFDNGGLRDALCSYPKPFICQKDRDLPDPVTSKELTSALNSESSSKARSSSAYESPTTSMQVTTPALSETISQEHYGTSMATTDQQSTKADIPFTEVDYPNTSLSLTGDTTTERLTSSRCPKSPTSTRSVFITESIISTSGKIRSSYSTESGLDPEAPEDPCLEAPCRNDGTCVADDDGYSCVCSSRFEGIYCEQVVDPCLKSPCRNGGTCLVRGADYTCKCSEDYQGRHCELEVPKEGSVSVEFKKAEAVTRIMASLGNNERTSIGYQVNDLLFYCRFNGKICNFSTDFTQMNNPFLGNCYTFNSKSATKTSSRYISTMSGRRHGLEVGVNLGLNDMFKAAGGVAGAVVLVHSEDTMPFPEDYGTVITPGVYNAISVRLVRIKRLPAPYSDCITADSDSTMKDAYVTLHNVTYSKAGCQKTCLQRHVMKACQCALPQYPRQGAPFVDVNTDEICDEGNATDKICIAKVELDISENALMCDCPNICHEDVYIATKSGSQWPMLKRMKSVIDGMRERYPKEFQVDDKNFYRDQRIIRQSFMKAAVFYEDLSHEIVSEVPVYSAYQFVGDIGGTLALWVGFSAMGLVQLIEFVLLMVYSKGCSILFRQDKVGIMKN